MIEGAGERAVEIEQAAFGICNPDTFAGAAQGVGEQADLAFEQARVGDVTNDGDGAGVFTIGVNLRAGGYVDGAAGAIGAEDDHLITADFAFAAAGHFMDDGGPIGGENELFDVAPFELAVGDAEDIFERGIGDERGAEFIDGADAVAGFAHDGAIALLALHQSLLGALAFDELMGSAAKGMAEGIDGQELKSGGAEDRDESDEPHVAGGGEVKSGEAANDAH